MVVVIVSPITEKIIKVLNTIEGFHYIKSKGPRCFYYLDNADNINTAIRNVKKTIVQTIGPMYVFEVYGTYNGMIDLFSYLPEDKKNTNKYYNQKKKDISSDELQNWKQENSLV